MRYLLISILFVIVSSCKVATVKNFTKSELIPDDQISNSYFSNPEIDYVYKADIRIYGNEFSGILVIKRIAIQKHRMVFTSQFGSTFFDIEFEKESYKINTIIEQLNRKILINTLIRDFSLLVQEKDEVIEKYNNKEYIVLKSKSDKRSNYYFYRFSDVLLQKIVHATTAKEKFIITYKDVSEDHIAKNICIDHKNIKLNIELNLLKK